MTGVEQPGSTDADSAETCAANPTLGTLEAKAMYRCHECGETFVLARDARYEFPEHWHFHLVHNHTGDTPSWVGQLFYRKPRGRYTEETKRIEALQKEQKKKAKTAGASRRANLARCGSCGADIQLDKVPYTCRCGKELA